MTRDQALDKVRKCLALSRSPNEHEAAAALRQAQALMRTHGIGDADVELADVAECRARARSPALNRWEVHLSNCIAEAFGCDVFSSRNVDFSGRRVRWFRDFVFVGVGGAQEIAGYAYTVLARQCAAARLAHIAKQPKRCLPITKTARGDMFAAGWVLGVSTLVQSFAGCPRNKGLIERHMAANHPDIQVAESRDSTAGRNAGLADRAAGFRAGKNADLKLGVGGAADRPLLAGTR